MSLSYLAHCLQLQTSHSTRLGSILVVVLYKCEGEKVKNVDTLEALGGCCCLQLSGILDLRTDGASGMAGRDIGGSARCHMDFDKFRSSGLCTDGEKLFH